VVAYVLTAAASLTALIPSLVGVLLACAAVARSRYAIGMHTALVVAVLAAWGRS
jgi:hypothetical protein